MRSAYPPSPNPSEIGFFTVDSITSWARATSRGGRSRPTACELYGATVCRLLSDVRHGHGLHPPATYFLSRSRISVRTLEDIAKKAGVTSKALADAMRRLFAAGRIWNEPCGYPYRPQYRIAEKP